MKTISIIIIVMISVVMGYVLYAQNVTKDVFGRDASFSDVAEEQKTSQEGETVEKVAYPQAPEFVEPQHFINTDALILADTLRQNKLVRIHFWTFGCINCKRTLSHLNTWHEKYHADGLEIIDIHTPEFAYERKRGNVEEFVRENNIRYPVFLDNDYKTWRAYNNRYWPRRYLVTPDGSIIFDHIGEGAYAETEAVIREMLYNE